MMNPLSEAIFCRSTDGLVFLLILSVSHYICCRSWIMFLAGSRRKKTLLVCYCSPFRTLNTCTDNYLLSDWSFNKVDHVYWKNSWNRTMLAAVQIYWNRPFSPSCLLPLFQNESWCTTFHMEMSLIWKAMNVQVKLISIGMGRRLPNFSCIFLLSRANKTSSYASYYLPSVFYSWICCCYFLARLSNFSLSMTIFPC